MCGSGADGAGALMVSGRRRGHDEVQAEVAKAMKSERTDMSQTYL
jgi:hypothetical protein